MGTGGTLGTINWFQGDASAFYGIQYHMSEKISLLAEYTPDTMSRESSYLDVKSQWNFGAAYQLNDYVNLSAQYLYSQVSFTAHVKINPGRPPLVGGKDLLPYQCVYAMKHFISKFMDKVTIRKVLRRRFEIQSLDFNDGTVSILPAS